MCEKCLDSIDRTGSFGTVLKSKYGYPDILGQKQVKEDCMLYRNAFRNWTVEVSDDPDFLGDQHEVFWSSTIRLNKPCDLFTIASALNPDDALVQLMLFEDGSTQAWSWIPTMIQTDPKRQHVVIGLLRPENCPMPLPHDSAMMP